MNDLEQDADTTDSDGTGPDPVAIPRTLAHLPVIAGMAVPWITAVTADGRPVFGQIDGLRHTTCLLLRLCQVCGSALTSRIVLLVRDRDLSNQFTAEPGLHPWCAAYSMRACPMVAGRMDHYRATPRSLTAGPVHSAPDDGDNDVLSALRDLTAFLDLAASLHQHAARRGAPAVPWSAVWVSDYRLITDPMTRTVSASFAHTPVLRVRRVSDLLTADDDPTWLAEDR